MTTYFETQQYPTTIATASADHCGACGSPLGSDQRYCLTCGERRGDPRLPSMSGQPATNGFVGPAYPLAPRPPSSRTSPAVVIAGIGTLLLAMGVGVLIGRSSGDTTTPQAAAPQIIQLAGGGGTGVAASSATPTAAATPAADSGSGSGAAKKAATSKASSGASAAAGATDKNGKVKKAQGTVVKVGQTGKGAGYKDGKFTGDFFGN